MLLFVFLLSLLDLTYPTCALTIPTTIPDRIESPPLLERAIATINNDPGTTLDIGNGWTFIVSQPATAFTATEEAAKQLIYLYQHAEEAASVYPPTPSPVTVFRVGEIVLIFHAFFADGEEAMIPWPVVAYYCSNMARYVSRGGFMRYEGWIRAGKVNIEVKMRIMPVS